MPGKSLNVIALFGSALFIACGSEGRSDVDAAPDADLPNVCGDGVVAGVEQCDDGVLNDDAAPDACRTDCRAAYCGDGVLDTGEICDEGTFNSDRPGATCRLNCGPPTCGDGVIDTGEICDDGPANSDCTPDACRSNCFAPHCGDGVIDPGAGEVCDGSPNQCADCALPCTDCDGDDYGDGAGCLGPDCDDTNPLISAGCGDPCDSTTCALGCCQAGVCVIATFQSRDACGFGGADCRPCSEECLSGTCTAICGDGIVDAGEECDDGNAISHDGCSSGCTVEQPVWTQLNPPSNISDRRYPGVALQASAGIIVLFGGEDGAPYDDTWLFDGTTWLPQTIVPSPPGRYGPMVYDAARDRMVIFGGSTSTAALGDTWELDGANWQETTPAPSPPPRVLHALAYDQARAVTVLFGGQDDVGGTELDDTWEYDGSQWVDTTPLFSPPARNEAALCYDPRRERVVLFGGEDLFGGYLDDTWEYDGTSWQLRLPPNSPPPRDAMALAYHPLLERIVLVGGWDGLELDDTWEYDGSTWSVTTTGPFSPRDSGGIAWAPRLRGLVYIAGNDNVNIDETWLYRYESAWPDEDCGNASDDDVDGLVDCDDPDCTDDPGC